MEFFKKHYKRIGVIFLGVLLLVSMVKGCSKSNAIRTMKAEYAVSDSVISAREDSIAVLWDSIDNLNKENKELSVRCDMYEGRVNDLNKALGRSVVVKINNPSDERK